MKLRALSLFAGLLLAGSTALANLKPHPGSLNFTWTPMEELGLKFDLALVESLEEINLDQRRPNRVWQAMKPVGATTTSHQKNSLQLEQRLASTMPGRDGLVPFVRNAEADSSRLVTRASWTCEPRTDTFLSLEVFLDLRNHPDVRLSMIDTAVPVKVVHPRLAEVIEKKLHVFNVGGRVPTRIFALQDIAGGRLTFTFDQPVLIDISPAPDGRSLRIRGLFGSGAPLVSGNLTCTVDWSPAGA